MFVMSLGQPTVGHHGSTPNPLYLLDMGAGVHPSSVQVWYVRVQVRCLEIGPVVYLCNALFIACEDELECQLESCHVARSWPLEWLLYLI